MEDSQTPSASREKSASITEMSDNEARHQEKVLAIGGSDPSDIPLVKFRELSFYNAESLPSVEYPDIYNYLITRPGYKNYKLFGLVC